MGLCVGDGAPDERCRSDGSGQLRPSIHRSSGRGLWSHQSRLATDSLARTTVQHRSKESAPAELDPVQPPCGGQLGGSERSFHERPRLPRNKNQGENNFILLREAKEAGDETAQATEKAPWKPKKKQKEDSEQS